MNTYRRILTGMLLAGLLFFVVTSSCAADAAAELVQPEMLTDFGGDLVDFEVIDIDRDGHQEIALLYSRHLEVGRFAAGRYERIAELEMPGFAEVLTLDGITTAEPTRTLLAVSSVKDFRASSMLIALDDGALCVVQNRIGYLFRRLSTSAGEAVLVGQGLSDKYSQPTYNSSKKYRLQFADGKLRDVGSFACPPHSSLFSLQPFASSNGKSLFATISSSRRLDVYDADSRIWQSEMRVGGTTVGFEVLDSTGGNTLSTVKNLIQLRLALGPDGTLLIPQNEGDRLGDRYTNFGPSQVVAMRWADGKLSEVWRTSRQDGGMVDFRLADIDNDGLDELTAAVILDPPGPGRVGKSSLVIYELVGQPGPAAAR